MPTIKILNAAGKYTDPQARQDVIAYICHPNKTPNHMIGGVQIDLQNIAQSMDAVAAQFGKNSGVRLRHLILSFHPKEVSSPSIFQLVANEVCTYIGREYQIAYAVHEDTAVPHIHFVFNTVSYVNGYKYRGNKEDHNRTIYLIKIALHNCGIRGYMGVKYYHGSYNPNE